MSLVKQVTSGVIWSFIAQVVRQGLQFLTAAILARLLSPSDFGVVGMATVVTGFILLFEDLGTSAAVIYRKDVSDKLLSSIFWCNVVFGIITMAVLLLIAPLVAIFYREPRVSPILRALSLNFVFQGISAVNRSLLQRRLSFSILTKIQIVAIVASSVVGIGTALTGAGVWSFVYQSWTNSIMTTILFVILSDWRPKAVFSWDEVKSVSSYSLHLTGFNIFNYFSRNADNFLVGRYLGAQVLGHYSVAYRLLLYPLQNVSSVVSRVMFPAFSKVQDDERFRRIYLRVTGAIASVTFPMMLGLMAVREPFVSSFFGLEWMPVADLLLVFSIVGLVQSVMTTVGLIYQAKGRTDLMFRWGLLSGALFAFSFVIGLKWGAIGVATAYAVSFAVVIYPGLAIPFKLINLTVRELIQSVQRHLLNSLLMVIVLSIIKALLPFSLSSAWVLGILVLVGVASYLLASWLFCREQVRQIVSLIETAITRIRTTGVREC